MGFDRLSPNGVFEALPRLTYIHRMATRFSNLPNRRAIIDRRAVADAIAALQGGKLERRAEATRILKDALGWGRAEIARRLEAHPAQGIETAAAYAFLTDQIVRLAYDFITTSLYPLANPTTGERLLLLAVGGYGRGEMALHSDVDIAFVTPWKPTGWTEQVIEAMLYLLWDLGWKVGHSSRSVGEVIRIAIDDQTVRTALLEMRYVWGDEALHTEVETRFWREVVGGNARQFIAEKLTERNARHKRMGDSRYVVEPNVKEGKGGLRDLHTLYWIGKYAYRVRALADLVEQGVMSAAELKRFQRAERFLWSVRCHLHLITGRPEERLSFDYQREIARRLRYADRPGKSAVERFMQHYFLQAKAVGDLTGMFLTQIDETFARSRNRFGFSRLRSPARVDGFLLDRGRLMLPSDRHFAEDPVRLLGLFATADKHEAEIHPSAMRAATRDARLIDAAVRADPRANALFMQVLTSPRDPEKVLRWMNEAGVFGRFVPDFGRVVAQMQFDMYHHYTVDEHSIRAIGLLSRIERGELKDDHPLATGLFRNISSRRTLYVAALLHDIAKGRGGDHSILGAEVAIKLCPRLGLDEAETETVAWLVRFHLLMSDTAMKRDISDPKTISDFAAKVASLERLRLLILLTIVDIRAVGPGVWNDWKRQLLRGLFDRAEEQLRLGHKQDGRRERVEAVQHDLAVRLGWAEDRFVAVAARLPDSYWLAEPIDALERNAGQVEAGAPYSATVQADRGATLVSVHGDDRPGLFYRLAGAISGAGGNIIDARVHTTNDGMALDNFLVQDLAGKPLSDPHQLCRLEERVRAALAGEEPPARSRPLDGPARHFPINPAVFVDNEASSRYSVLEINAADRPALLADLAHAIYRCGAAIRSAHVATYGERAVDVFYLTGEDGGKITGAKPLKALQRELLGAAANAIGQAAA